MSEIQMLINGKPKEFAEFTGIPYNTVLKWSNGSRTPPPWVIALIKLKLKYFPGDPLKIHNEIEDCNKLFNEKVN